MEGEGGLQSHWQALAMGGSTDSSRMWWVTRLPSHDYQSEAQQEAEEFQGMWAMVNLDSIVLGPGPTGPQTGSATSALAGPPPLPSHVTPPTPMGGRKRQLGHDDPSDPACLTHQTKRRRLAR